MDPAARLDELRERAAAEGDEWLRSELEKESAKFLVALGRAACLRVKVGKDTLGKDVVVAMLVEKLAAKAAGPEVA